MLNVAIIGGPLQQILRPAELEASTLVESLHQQALFGEQCIFDRSKGMENGIDGAVLFLEQEAGSRIQLDEQGSLLLRLSLEPSNGRSRSGFGGLFALIEETVIQQINAAIAYAAWTLDHIDSIQRLTHVVVATSIDASDHLGWRTQAEQNASPNSGTMGIGGNEARPPVHVDRPRAALRFDANRLAEDLMVPLRRQRKSR